MVLDWHSRSLLLLFLLSFTQGDVSLYGNWWERASQDGLAATSTMFDQSTVEQGYKGMIAISIGLLFASALLWKLMDRRWAKPSFQIEDTRGLSEVS